MTKEEKQILLKDLCARLPYGVFIHYHWSREGNTIDEDRELDFSDVETLKYNIENPQNDWCEISWKPYLRPMSSMTEEEEKVFNDFLEFQAEYVSDADLYNKTDMYDWLLAHHFDYRIVPSTGKNMIESNLAIEAPKDMYKNE